MAIRTHTANVEGESDSNELTKDDIHGYICNECARTHCLTSLRCECHKSGCRGTVKPIGEVISE